MRAKRTAMDLRCWRALVAPLAWCIALLLPQGVALADWRVGYDVTLEGTLAQQQFLAGRDVHLRADVTDKVFAAGRRITSDGGRIDMLVAAGTRIELKNSTFRDLLVAGTEVILDSTVENDVDAAVCPMCWWSSGRFELGSNGRIGDEARLAAGAIEIKGTVGGNLFAVARRIVISGTITGKADLRAKEIVIASGAQLGGELIAHSPSTPEIAADAKVAGPLRHTPSRFDLPEPRELVRRMVWIAVIGAIGVSLGIFVLGAALQIALPDLLQGAADRLSERPWGSIGRGLAWILLLHAAIFVASVTIIGIPLAVVLLAGLVILVTLGLVVAAYALGLWLRHRRKEPVVPLGTSGRIAWTLLGLAIILLVNVIPVIGWIFAFLAFLAGLGAVAGSVWRRLRVA